MTLRNAFTVVVTIAWTALGLGLSQPAKANQPTSQEAGLAFINACEKKLTTLDELDPEVPNQEIDRLNREMNVEVIGQNQALSVVADAIETSLAFLNDPNRPLGRFLFVGPTGVGKTETVKAMIKSLGGDADKHLTRIDCGEFQHGHEISRIIGASAGYVGYGEKPMLHPAELEKRRIKVKTANGQTIEINVILIDEIEKAGDTLFKLALGLLDNGKVTLGDNTESNLRKTIVIATSNLGAKAVEALIVAREAKLKAQCSNAPLAIAETDVTGRHNLSFRNEIHCTYMDAIKSKFAPEFINRWQKIVQFLHLSEPEFYQILQKQLSRFQKRVFEQAEVKVGVLFSDTARQLIVSKGTDFKNGARELETTIEGLVTKPMARLISTGQAKEGDILIADVNSITQNLTWKVAVRGLERAKLLEFADIAYPGYKMKEVNFNKRIEEQAAAGATNVFDILLSNEAAVKKLYLHAKSATKVDLNMPTSDGKSLVATCKYVKIDDRYVRLENFASGMKAKIQSEVTASIKEKFPETGIPLYTEKEVLDVVKEEIKK